MVRRGAGVQPAQDLTVAASNGDRYTGAVTKSKVSDKVFSTAKWAETMATWHITYSGRPGALGTKKARTVKWQLISFLGPNGHDARGIVDMMAIRKDHKTEGTRVKRGDRFEIVLIQIKGGGARRPTKEDVTRLRRIHRRYRAKASVWVHWKRKQSIVWHRLRPSARAPWAKVDNLREIFG